MPIKECTNAILGERPLCSSGDAHRNKLRLVSELAAQRLVVGLRQMAADPKATVTMQARVDHPKALTMGPDQASDRNPHATRGLPTCTVTARLRLQLHLFSWQDMLDLGVLRTLL